MTDFIRRLASLLPGKTRRQSSITMLYYFFCGKKIRKENSLNNLTTCILSFSSPPARKVTGERKRAPRAGGTPSSRVAIVINLARSFVGSRNWPGLRDQWNLVTSEIYIIHPFLLLLMTFTISSLPPPPPSSFPKQIWVVPILNPSKVFSDPRFWVLSYNWSPLLFSQKSSEPPYNSPAPPPGDK